MSFVRAESSETHLEQQVEDLSRKLQGDAERQYTSEGSLQ